MNFEEWLTSEYREDAEWYEGWNKGDMRAAYSAAIDEAIKEANQSVTCKVLAQRLEKLKG